MQNVRRLALIWFLFSGICACSPQLPAAVLLGKAVMPSGTILKVVLADAISTDRSLPGDHFSGRLSEPIVINGRPLFEKGTKVRGLVVDLREPRLGNGGAALHLVLTEIAHEGKSIAIITNHFVITIDGTVIGTRGRDVDLAINAHVDFVLATPVEI